MTKPKTFSTALFALLLAARVLALDIYVATNGTGSGTSWADATNSIAGAAQFLTDNYAYEGGTVWISNGVYTGVAWEGDFDTPINFQGKTGNPADITLIGNGSDPVFRGYLSSYGCVDVTITGGGGEAALISSLARNCVITGNVGTAAGGMKGGIAYWSTIGWNTSNGGAGGVVEDGRLLMYSCLIVENTGRIGGASGTDVDMFNCTVAGNVGTNGAGGLSGISAFRNSISWGNSGDEDTSIAGQVQYSCGQGDAYTNEFQVGCITNDPLFVGSGDYHLQAGSPCINTGTNSTWTLTTDADLDGNKRRWPANGQADMGAYEFGSQPEYLKKVFLMKSN